MWSKFWVALSIAAVLFLNSCVNNMTSPYVNRYEGEVYAYGNFCGPMRPADQLSMPPEERIAYLRSIPAIDDIDRACKAHDLCYASFGEDLYWCDQMMTYLLFTQSPSDDFSGSFQQATACAGLQHEVFIIFDFGAKQQRKAPKTDRAVRRVLSVPFGIIQGGVAVLASPTNTWPEEGTCFLNDRSMSFRVQNAMPAYRRAALEAGCSAEELADGSMTPNTCGFALLTPRSDSLTASHMFGDADILAFR